MPSLGSCLCAGNDALTWVACPRKCNHAPLLLQPAVGRGYLLPRARELCQKYGTRYRKGGGFPVNLYPVPGIGIVYTRYRVLEIFSSVVSSSDAVYRIQVDPSRNRAYGTSAGGINQAPKLGIGFRGRGDSPSLILGIGFPSMV